MCIHIYLPGEILDSQQFAVLLEPGVACAGERSGVLLCQLPLELVAVQGGLLVAGHTHQQDVVGEVVLQVGWKQSVRDGKLAVMVALEIYDCVMCVHTLYVHCVIYTCMCVCAYIVCTLWFVHTLYVHRTLV